jgi:hypothetical protein
VIATEFSFLAGAHREQRAFVDQRFSVDLETFTTRS